MALEPNQDPPPSSFSSSTTTSFSSPMEPAIVLSIPVLPLLHGYNLTNFIASSPLSPTISSATCDIQINPTFSSWHRQDQLLLGWLRSSLTEPILAQVVSSSSTFELWTTLQKLYSSHSGARLSELRRQIQSASKRDSSCSDYLQQIRRTADELASTGAPLSDEDLVLAIINGLGSDFNAIVATMITSSRLEPLSFSDLHSLLLSHEALVKTQSSSLPTAFYDGRNGFFKKNQFRSQFPPFGSYPTHYTSLTQPKSEPF